MEILLFFKVRMYIKPEYRIAFYHMNFANGDQKSEYTMNGCYKSLYKKYMQVYLHMRMVKPNDMSFYN